MVNYKANSGKTARTFKLRCEGHRHKTTFTKKNYKTGSTLSTHILKQKRFILVLILTSITLSPVQICYKFDIMQVGVDTENMFFNSILKWVKNNTRY